VWKTLGVPITNVSSRFGAIDVGGRRMVGLNNIELITDRPLETNLKEIADVKRRYPAHAVVASLMFETQAEWQDIVKRCQDAGADGLELNFGCPHGMCERGMGSAVGQEPAVLEKITSWAKEFAKRPVLVKLTPAVRSIEEVGLAARRGGADGVSLINTIKSLMGVDLDRMTPLPNVGGRSTNGGYCGPAVKPIALFLVGSLAREPQFGLPISGIGGIANWRDAAEFMALGATTVQVCTAAMHHGFKIVEDMIDGLECFLDEKGMRSAMELVGRATPSFVDWGDLDLNYKVVAAIDPQKCIGCQLCYVACWDGAHQCIDLPSPAAAVGGGNGHEHGNSDSPPVPAWRVPVIREADCIGCNLCSLVCPVPGCVSMVERPTGKTAVSWNDFTAAGMKAELLAPRPHP
jgi:dihydropyrimidine dehydrogenase (NAD+) subunit PreA